jgi:hypothetical protein
MMLKTLLAPFNRLKRLEVVRRLVCIMELDRQAQATGNTHVAWESGEAHIGDLLMKLMLGPRFNGLTGY